MLRVFSSEDKVKMKLLKLVFAVVLGMTVVGSCEPRDKTERTRGAKDLENALEIIEGRREAEYAVIENQAAEIRLLRENQKSVKTEGMRNKLENDILMKTTAIEKAKKNIANQDTVIIQLRMKLDSIRAAE